VTPRIFLLSPVNCGGTRARQLLASTSRAELASRLRSPQGAPIGEVFAFVSGLYFRGKLTYARRFARPPEPDHPVIGSGIHVITPNAGLCSPEQPLTATELAHLSGDLIAPDNPAFTVPLARTARTLLPEIGPDCEVVLLGSIASPKYVDVLLDVFGDQLRFPIAFIGRGDMSRGGLLLRQVDAGVELEYGLVRGAVRNGVRPAKLDPSTRPPRPPSTRTTGDQA
jgi:hypothetical protein